MKKVALTHMAINLAAAVLYAIDIWLRASLPTDLGTSLSAPVVLSIIGVSGTGRRRNEDGNGEF